MTAILHGDLGLQLPDGSWMARIPRNWIDGLTLVWVNGSTFSISPGQCTNDANTQLIDLPGPGQFVMTSASWSVGSGNGGLDTGAIAASAWYHVFVIRNPITGSVDGIMSLSPTAPTMPAGYTQRRRIGSVRTEGGFFSQFTQFGDEFLWLTLTQDVNIANPGNVAVLSTFRVPTGVKVTAIVNARLVITTSAGTEHLYLMTSPDVNDVNPGTGPCQVNVTQDTRDCTQIRMRTNTNAQLRSRMAPGTNITMQFYTEGWIDPRGRHA
jgi:hypothetical protein